MKRKGHLWYHDPIQGRKRPDGHKTVIAKRSWFNKAAQWLYTLMCRFGHWIRPAVKKDLWYLYPGEDQENLCKSYYVKKIEKSLTIFTAGCVLAILLAVRAAGERRLEQGNALKREGILGESQKVTVEARFDGQKETFEILMEPLCLSTEEAEACYEEFCRELPHLIAGENSSLQEVTQNLNLQEQYEGYPFLVEWKSADVSCIASDGVIKPGEREQDVLLTASITYEEQAWRQQLSVRVPAETLTAEEQRYRELAGQLFHTEERTRMEEYLFLPESIDGAPVKWQRAVEDYSVTLWVGALIVSGLVFILGDRDLHSRLQRQREHMKREYPDIVHKLVLYLGAGMTLQGAFQKVAAEYEHYRAAGGMRKSPVCEQMIYTCRDLKSGISEDTAYEHFGKRTGLQEYIRLSTLMTQNLKKGSSSLLSRLREEADKALTERIQAGKRLGEEASTKLLIPMVMMLAVVMIMVILPAFSSMGL